MSKIIENQAEVREAESSAEQQLRQVTKWLRGIRSAKVMGRVGRMMEAAYQFNIFTAEGYKSLGHTDWKDYCKAISLNRWTADRAISLGAALAKLCPKATTLDQNGRIIFDDKTMKSVFQKFYEDNSNMTLEDLRAMNIADDMVGRAFYDEQSGKEISTEDIIAQLTDGAVPQSQGPAMGIEASVRPVVIDPSTQRYMDEHGLLYDKVRGIINRDGTALTEQQQVDMTSYESARGALENLRLALAKQLKGISDVMTNGESYMLYIKKGNNKFAEEAQEIFRDCAQLTERCRIATNAFYEGDANMMHWALTAKAEEILASI